MSHKGMVFGVFDGLHEGHKHFLLEAVKLCDELIVVVTPDDTVENLKGRQPKNCFKDRAEAVRVFNPVCTVVEGDFGIGEWVVLTTYKPDSVILGYDQQKIAREMSLLNTPYKFVSAHKPEQFKSSFL